MTSFWQLFLLHFLSLHPATTAEAEAVAVVVVVARWCPDVLIKFWTWREIASGNFVVWFCAAQKFHLFSLLPYAPCPSPPTAHFIWIISCKVCWEERRVRRRTGFPPPPLHVIPFLSLSTRSQGSAASFLFGQLQIRINFLDVPIYLFVYERALMKTEHGHDSLARRETA